MHRLHDLSLAIERRRTLHRRRSMVWRTAGLLAAMFFAWGLAAHAQAPALTTVQDNIYLANGTLTIVATHDFTTPDGVPVAQGQEWTPTVTNGAFSVALPPNIGSTPSGTSYTVYYNITPGGQYTRTWIVPQSGTPVNLADVQSAGPPPTPAVMFPLAQIVPLANCVLGVPQVNSAGTGWQCSTPLVNPMTGVGDLLVGGASGAASRLPAAGSAGLVLTSNAPGTVPTWQAGGAAGVASFDTRTGAVTLTASDVDAIGAITNSTSGNAGTATALATTPTQCPSTQIVTGVAANGDANCQDPLVSGPTAIGAAPGVNNPVFMGGWDGTDIRALLTDTSGHAIVNINGTVPVSGTFWQATQPVSIATLPALAAGAATIGAVDQAGSWTVGITGAIPAGANTIGGVNIENVPGVNIAQLNGVALASPTAYGTAPTGNALGVNADVTNTVTVAQTTGSNLHVNVDNLPSTQPVSGTVTANQGSAGSTPWPVTAQPSSASAAALTNFTPAFVTSAATIDASPGNLLSFQVWDSGSAACYLEFFNAASGSVTLGTTPPIWVVGLFPTSSNSFEANSPAGFALNFSTALSVAAVTTEGGSTTCPSSTAFLNAGYK